MKGSCQPPVASDQRCTCKTGARRLRNPSLQTLAASRRLPARGRTRPVARAGGNGALSGAGGCLPEDREHPGGDDGDLLRLRIRPGLSLVRLLLEQAVEKAGVDLGRLKVRVAEDAAEQRDVGLNPAHEILVQSPPESSDGLIAVGTIPDQLREER